MTYLQYNTAQAVFIVILGYLLNTELSLNPQN